MIEIVFNDSACGSLKMAQHYGEGPYENQSIGIIMDHSEDYGPTDKKIEDVRQKPERRERATWENAKPLGGNPADVYGFDLTLSVGDISEDIPGPRRQQALKWLWSIYPDYEEPQTTQDLRQEVKDALNAIRSRAEAGEPLRIWYSNQPDDMCGLCWLMTQLVQWKKPCSQLSLVRLPEWEVDNSNYIVYRHNWGEVPPGEWHRYLLLQKNVPLLLCESLALHWQSLQRENAPLRAVLNGNLVSAPETLYDHIIQREIAAEENVFQEAMIVGRVLGKYRLGIRDTWVALRIEEMIRAGILEPVSEAAADSPVYHRMLRKRMNTD